MDLEDDAKRSSLRAPYYLRSSWEGQIARGESRHSRTGTTAQQKQKRKSEKAKKSANKSRNQITALQFNTNGETFLAENSHVATVDAHSNDSMLPYSPPPLYPLQFFTSLEKR